MLRALFKQGSFWTIINEKTFRDLGSGFAVVKTFIDWHKKYIEWWRKK